MENGWIKLYRCSIESRVFQNEGLLKLWMLCLLKANHKEGWFSVDDGVETIKVMPGEFVTGRYSLHKEYYPRKGSNQKTPLTIWRWLQTLEKYGNLNIKTNNRYSLITVTKWGTYQSGETIKEHQSEQQVNIKRTTDEQQVNTNNNVKKDKNEKKKIKTFLLDSIEYQLAELLHNEILKINPEHKANLQTWSKEIDLMIRIDNRIPDKIKDVIRWCQRDSFWQSNILSTKKLRTQYDQLLINMKSKPKGAGSGKHTGLNEKDYSEGIGEDGSF